MKSSIGVAPGPAQVYRTWHTACVVSQYDTSKPSAYASANTRMYVVVTRAAKGHTGLPASPRITVCCTQQCQSNITFAESVVTNSYFMPSLAQPPTYRRIRV